MHVSVSVRNRTEKTREQTVRLFPNKDMPMLYLLTGNDVQTWQCSSHPLIQG